MASGKGQGCGLKFGGFELGRWTRSHHARRPALIAVQKFDVMIAIVSSPRPPALSDGRWWWWAMVVMGDGGGDGQRW